MKASILIEKLTKLLKEHGDLEVGFDGDNGLVNLVKYEEHNWILSPGNNSLNEKDWASGFIMYEYYS